jgi:3-oxoadipate enol-lactonase
MPYVQRQGLNVYYESHGRGLPVVLLHPLSLNHYFWVHQLFAFARTNRVLVMDHRGHGLSDKPAMGYSIAEMTADLRSVLDDAKIERAVLVGCSAGSMIALQAAVEDPVRVAALVLVSGATKLAPQIPPAVVQAYEQRFEAAFDYMIQGPTSAVTKRARPEVPTFLSDVYRVPSNFSPDVFVSCIRDPGGVFNWDVSTRLKDIRQPVLVLAGEEDQTMPLEAMRMLGASIPGANFKLVPGVGHYYPLERPRAFNADLRAFLGRVA